MRTSRLLGILTLLTALALTTAPAHAEFDFTIDVLPSSSKAIKMERTGPARDFVQRAAVYLRYVPLKAGQRVFPAFINTHNYLTCADKPEKKWYLESVSRVDYDKGSGIAVYGFFFSRPACDGPTFHMEAVTTES
ncbi:MAG: hypothetical protein IT294_00910 [Deltaproteobacteria bacterium]|nr:hypothetical protein [Deltaproteobacteria bacterium]